MADPLSMSVAQVESLAAPQAAVVLAAWVQAKRTELPLALSTSSSKVHARLAKKALYQLRSVGVATGDVAPPAPEPVPAAPTPASDDGLLGVLTTVVGNGERGVLFARPLRGGGVEVYEALVQDEQGLISLERGETSRGAYRERLKALRQSENRVLLVPFERIREELGRALVHNAPSKIPVSLDAQAALARLEVTVVKSPLPIDPPTPTDEALADRAAELHEEPEMVSWLPAESAIGQLGKQYEAEPSAPPERRVELARAFAQQAETTELRAVYASRLWRMAEFFDGTERRARGDLARAEAKRLLHTTTRSAFLEQMMVKVASL